MRKLFYKISATLLSLVVLFSTMSFTIDRHYCGDTLVDVAYFGKADDCGGAMKMKKASQKIQKKKCCKNEVEVIESTTFDKEKLTKLTLQKVEFVVFHLYSYINSYQEISLEKEFYKDFSPPDLEQNIQVLHQTFLI